MLRFPKGFLWGAATSSYQIEGASHTDGRGESIWDRFAKVPAKIADGSDGAIACDHYHRWPEDIELMKRLGLDSYRFSVAWPRIFPSGRFDVNEAGLDFYDRLVDGLLAADIAPMVTLYHWDLPQALEDEGGWTSRGIVDAFTAYVDVVTDRLGDRVRQFITHNEPWCISVLGYAEGLHAPGRRDWNAALAAAHHVLLSHGLAVPIIRQNAPDAEVGITLNLAPVQAASTSEADEEACREFDGQFNRWFLDPLFGHPYPEDAIADHVRFGRIPSADLPFVHPGDDAIIATPCDFLGVNYYSRAIMRSDRVPEAQNAPRTVVQSDDRTDFGWEVYPEGLKTLLLRIHETYTPAKIYITENGAAYDTGPDQQGRVHDIERQRYLYGHLQAVLEACNAGVPVEGYFVWSLLDNYEWQEGYRKRFGIVWVDFATQERIPKESYTLYQTVIADHGLSDVWPHEAQAKRRLMQR
jgi:beta-glucosidase